MFEKIRNLFNRRSKYASPYYGCGDTLFNGSALPLRRDTEPEPEKKQAEIPHEASVCPKPNAVDWEQRRFELYKMLLAQERRSVVLGKLQATHKQVANTARVLTDAGIKELQTNPYKSQEHEKGDKEE